MDSNSLPVRMTPPSSSAWPFDADFDLKVRVAVADTSGDNVVVLYMLQDSNYLSRSNDAPERHALNWKSAIQRASLPEGSTAEVEIVETRRFGRHNDHVDVLIVLGQWIGSGAVSLLISELWRKIREPEAERIRSHHTVVSSLGESSPETFARWSIAAQYFDPVVEDPEGYWGQSEAFDVRARPWKDNSTLELLSESTKKNGWEFCFRDKSGIVYRIEIELVEQITFACVSTISRQLPKVWLGHDRRRPTLKRYWYQGRHGTRGPHRNP